MGSKLDIRAQIAADAALQAEIGQALMAIADSLPQATELRMARIVLRTLDASWDEHVSFQDEVVFPIVLGRHARHTAHIVERLRADHAGLASRHAATGRHLQGVLNGETNELAELEQTLRATFEFRRDHLHVDAELSGWLPPAFSAAELSLCCDWEDSRPTPRFPLNVLRATQRRSFRFGGDGGH